MELDYSDFERTLTKLNLEIIDKLGSGAFGIVLACKSSTDQSTYAVKIVKLCDGYSNEEHLREVRLVSGLSHPNIIRYNFSRTKMINQTTYLFIQMEFCVGGSLREVIDNGKLKSSHVKMWKIFEGILMGLDFLHTEGLIHRDLKPENLLLDSSDVPKIADFGLIARQNVSKLTYGPGTDLYMAPEAILGGYNTKVDIYSLGLVLFELYLSLGEESHVSFNTTNDFRQQKLFPEAFFGCGSEIETKPAQEVILHMTNELPERRPTTQQLIQSLTIPEDGEIYSLKECVDSAYITHEMTKIKEVKFQGQHCERLELCLTLVNSGVVLKKPEQEEILEACEALSLKVGEEKFFQTAVEDVSHHRDLTQQVLDWLLKHADVDLMKGVLDQWMNSQYELAQREGNGVDKEEFAIEAMKTAFDDLKRFPALHPKVIDILFIRAQQISDLPTRSVYLQRIQHNSRAAESDATVALSEDQLAKSKNVLNRIATEIENIERRSQLLEDYKAAHAQQNFAKCLQCMTSVIEKGLGLNSEEIRLLTDACMPLTCLLALARSQTHAMQEITTGEEVDKLQKLANLFGILVEDMQNHSKLAIATIETVISSSVVTLALGQPRLLLEVYFLNHFYVDWNLEAPTDEALEKHINRVFDICTGQHGAYFALIVIVRDRCERLLDLRIKVRFLSKVVYLVEDTAKNWTFDDASLEELQKTRDRLLAIVREQPEIVIQMAQKAGRDESYVMAIRLWNVIIDAGVNLSIEDVQEMAQVTQPFNKAVRKELREQYKKLEIACCFYRIEALTEWLLRFDQDDEWACRWLQVRYDNCIFINDLVGERSPSDIALEILANAKSCFSDSKSQISAERFRLLLGLIQKISSYERQQEELVELKSALHPLINSDKESMLAAILEAEEMLRTERQKLHRRTLAQNAIKARNFRNALEIWNSIVKITLKLNSEERAELLNTCSPLREFVSPKELKATSRASVKEFSYLAIATLERLMEQDEDLSERELHNISEIIRANQLERSDDEVQQRKAGTKIFSQSAAFFTHQTNFWNAVEERRKEIFHLTEPIEKLNAMSELLYSLECYEADRRMRSPNHQDILDMLRNEIRKFPASLRDEVIVAPEKASKEGDYAKRLRLWHAVLQSDEGLPLETIPQVLEITDSLSRYGTEKTLRRTPREARIEYAYRALSLLKFCLENASEADICKCVKNIKNHVVDCRILFGSLAEGDFMWNLERSLTDTAFQRLATKWKNMNAENIWEILEQIKEKQNLLDKAAQHKEEKDFMQSHRCWYSMLSKYPISKTEQKQLLQCCRPLKELVTEDEFEKYTTEEIIGHSTRAVLTLKLHLQKDEMLLPNERSEALAIAWRNQKEQLRYSSEGNPFYAFEEVDFVDWSHKVFSGIPLNDWESIRTISKFIMKTKVEQRERNLTTLISEVEEYELENPHRWNHRSAFEMAVVRKELAAIRAQRESSEE